MSIPGRQPLAVGLAAVLACAIAARPATTQAPGDAPQAENEPPSSPGVSPSPPEVPASPPETPASPPETPASPPGVPARLRAADGGDVPGRWLQGPGILWQADGEAGSPTPTPIEAARLILKPLPDARDMTPLRRHRAQAEARRKAALRGAWRPPNASAATTGPGAAGEDSPPTPAAETAWEHAIHLRGGEVLPGRLSAIDDAAVRFTTERLGEGRFPHDEVRMLELGDAGEPARLADSRRRRLMTLPRTQTDSPPSHLLVFADGDYLRGRLSSVDGERLTFATPAGELPIERSRVVGIAWLTPPDDPGGAPDRPDAFHVTRTDGARLTLRDLTHRDGVVQGEHPVLSTCQIPVGEIAEVRRGVDPAFPHPPASGVVWRLRAAPLPLVDRLDEATPAEDRSPSPGDR